MVTYLIHEAAGTTPRVNPEFGKPRCSERLHVFSEPTFRGDKEEVTGKRRNEGLWMKAMELKVWVDGVQRIVCGVTEFTTCQEVCVYLSCSQGAKGPHSPEVNSKDKGSPTVTDAVLHVAQEDIL
ncbi:hypothetical protein INR49_016580 [Caranx melampygus]|nr:hypothetical protein INR49_016580 [Caranx melampygus]